MRSIRIDANRICSNLKKNNICKNKLSFSVDLADEFCTYKHQKSQKFLRQKGIFCLFLNEYPAACCGWDGQETDLRNGAYSMLND